MSDSEARQAGLAMVEKLMGEVPPDFLEPKGMKAGFATATVDHLFGDILTRPGLALRDRSLITISVLTAFERLPQLRGHLTIAKRLGITSEEVSEMMLHVAHHAGWSVALTALQVAEEVYAE